MGSFETISAGGADKVAAIWCLNCTLLNIKYVSFKYIFYCNSDIDVNQPHHSKMNLSEKKQKRNCSQQAVAQYAFTSR